MSANYTPLPAIDPERDGVSFENLALPVGFDEERLLINTTAVRRVASVACLSGVTLIGETGKKSETEIGITSVGSDGSASASGSLKQRRENLINDVWVASVDEHNIWAKHYEVDSTRNAYFNSPVIISANVTERDERLRTSGRKYPQGQFDARGHADFLNQTMSNGLHEAAHQRFLQYYGDIPALRFIVYSLFGFALAESGVDQSPMPLVAAAGVYAALDMLKAFDDKKDYGLKFNARNWSAARGLDRKLGAQTLAAASTFVKARK